MHNAPQNRCAHFKQKLAFMPSKKNATFQVKVNDFEFSFTQEEIDAADFLQRSGANVHLLKNHRSFNAVLREMDASGKQQLLEIGGQRYVVQIKDELDQMLDKMGYSTDTGKKIKELKAPMPGLVLEVFVSEGQQVKAGEKLLILVAMKMENSILAQADATVQRLHIAAGEAVEKGQLLLTFE